MAGKTKTSDSRYISMLNLRLTPEERRFLALRAEEAGCTLSQAVRLLVFKSQGSAAENLSVSELEHRKVLALKGTRNEFKKLVAQYATVVETLLSCDMDDVQKERHLRSLENITIDLQKSVNAALSVVNEREVHLVSRRFGPGKKDAPGAGEASVAARKIRNFKLNYCYMEKIMVIGFLASDAEEYDKNGTKKMRFGVLVERKSKEGKKRILYSVFSARDGSFDFLKKGRQVFVEGTFGESDKGEKMIFADTIRLMGEE